MGNGMLVRDVESAAKPNIEGVLFDFDGTLADTLGSITDAVNLTMEHFGFPLKTEAQVRLAIGNGARLLARRIAPPDQADDETLVERIYEHYCASYEKTFIGCRHPYDGIPELLFALKDKGIKLGVVSNKPDYMTQELCRSLFGSGFFDFVRGQTELPLKPDPAVLLAGADAFGIDPSRCAMVGDGETDVKAAGRAGMLPIGVCWGYREKQQLISAGEVITVDTVEELARVLGVKL